MMEKRDDLEKEVPHPVGAGIVVQLPASSCPPSTAGAPAGRLAAFVLAPSRDVALLRLGRALRARTRYGSACTPSLQGWSRTCGGLYFAAFAAAACASLLLVSCYSSRDLVGDGAEDAAHDPAADRHPDPIVDRPPDPAPDPVPDPIPDVAVDDVPADEIPGPGITFILGFITDIPGFEYLYAQTGDMSCRMKWVSITDGARSFSMEDDCAICPCEQCGSCAVCGVCIPMAAAVPGGESISYTWDGTIYAMSMCSPYPDEDWACETPGPLAFGDYIARFCFAVAGPGAFPDGIITAPTCRDVPFTYPIPGGVVSYTVNNGG